MQNTGKPQSSVLVAGDENQMLDITTVVELIQENRLDIAEDMLRIIEDLSMCVYPELEASQRQSNVYMLFQLLRAFKGIKVYETSPKNIQQ